MNEKKRGRPKSKDVSLSAEKILHCAKTMLKNDEKIPSIRKLATALEIDPMAIYHYFKNKNLLLEALTISLIEDIYTPKADNWKIELKKLSWSYLQLLKTYNGLLEIFLTMKSAGPAQVFTEKYNIAVHNIDISDEKKTKICILLVDYLHGFAYSMNCNPNDSNLNIESSSESLELIFSLLNTHVK
jgi:hypothetical protein